VYFFRKSDMDGTEQGRKLVRRKEELHQAISVTCFERCADNFRTEKLDLREDLCTHRYNTVLEVIVQ
jgi:hypothetical protein